MKTITCKNLFDSLNNFYKLWSQGYFIDRPINDNYPQKIRQQLKQNNELILGLRQVDIYTGLNVTILLLELHRFGRKSSDFNNQLIFSPCGIYDDTGMPQDPNLLLRLIGYSNCIGIDSFTQIVGNFLAENNFARINLNGATLSKANLNATNLNSASLRGTDLYSANLSYANLQQADLISANLGCANLKGADLYGADLSCANFRSANLKETNLFGAKFNLAIMKAANLKGVDLLGVDLKGANLFRADCHNTILLGADLYGAN